MTEPSRLTRVPESRAVGHLRSSSEATLNSSLDLVWNQKTGPEIWRTKPTRVVRFKRHMYTTMGKFSCQFCSAIPSKYFTASTVPLSRALNNPIHHSTDFIHFDGTVNSAPVAARPSDASNIAQAAPTTIKRKRKKRSDIDGRAPRRQRTNGPPAPAVFGIDLVTEPTYIPIAAPKGPLGSIVAEAHSTHSSAAAASDV
ncbi:hypothetical protein C8J56DRAFT_1126436 [Mycena floridula]|nr:hypothetical protein C8J56DRAFT_1126436 [Mycena floridula]